MNEKELKQGLEVVKEVLKKMTDEEFEAFYARLEME